MNIHHSVAAIGRLLLAGIFLLSGLGKLADPAAAIDYIHSAGLPLPQVAFAVAALIEVGGGLALVLGFQTRIAAAILSIFSLAAAVAFHNNFADPNQVIHFLKNISMIGGLLQVIAFGAGTLSLDARRVNGWRSAAMRC